MASYYDKLESAHNQWEKESPCLVKCPIPGRKCQGPCAVYNEWLDNEPIKRAIREVELDVKRARGAAREAEDKLITMKEMRERILKP